MNTSSPKLHLLRLGIIGALSLAVAVSPSFGQGPRPVSKQELEGWIEELSNWGRWGKDDQLGTLNLITAKKRMEAAKLVKAGVSVSLAHDVLREQAPDNDNPFQHQMGLTGASPGPWAVDTVSVLFHGYAHSHLDAVCHRFHDGKIYNGYPRSSVTEAGCDKLAIQVMKNGIFTRGVLMDLPKLKGVPWLEPGTAIYPEDLEAWEKKAGLKVESGDVLLIRTGRWARRAAEGAWDVGASSAGLHASCVKWMKERGVAVLGSDAASDVFPSGVEGYTHPVHLLTLVALGTPILDNQDLEALSAEAERQGRWEFLLTAAPLAIPGGTGSPLNAIATF